MGVRDRLRKFLKPPKPSRPAPRPPVVRPPPPPPEPRAPVDADGVAHELVLYKYDACPYCARVQRTVRELGLTLSYRDTREEDGAREELRERTGRTTVPCLFIDGEPLFESADIIDYLRRTYPLPS